MGGVCSTHGRDEKCVRNLLSENQKGRENLGDLGVGGRIV
jgi:hypothetical protein